MVPRLLFPKLTRNCKNHRKSIFLLIITIFFTFSAQGQDRVEKEQGIPFPYAHYSSEAYEEHPQNWDIVQDDRGIIYVANNNGVLEYDGETWRTIEIQTDAFVRSLAADSAIYVGGTGNFGVLRPDSVGALRYVSLSDDLPAEERNFGDVWNTHATEEGVYYQANSRLFRWDGDEIESWESEEGFHTSFAVRGRFFVRDFGQGLLEMKGDSLRPVPRGDAFEGTPIYMMAPHPGGRILVGTQNRGLLLYDGERLESFAPDATPYLQEQNFYHGTALPDGRYALATLGGGVVLMDRNGGVDQVLDDELPDGVVNRLYAEEEGTLWMALNNGGVFRGNVRNAVSLYDDRLGLKGLVEDVERIDGRLHVATSAGLYNLVSSEQKGIPVAGWTFRRNGSITLGRELLSKQEEALLASQEAIFQWQGEEWTKEIEKEAFDLHVGIEGEVVYAGLTEGLLLIRPAGGRWLSQSVVGIEDEIRVVLEEEPGTLWVTNKRGEVGRLYLSEDRTRVRAEKWFGADYGLSEELKHLTRIGDAVYVVSKEKVFRVRKRNGEEVLERVSDLLPPDTAAAELKIQTLKEGPNGDLWFARGDRVYRGRKTGRGDYDWTSVSALHVPKDDINRIYLEKDGVVWFGSGKRLFRYDSNAATAPPPREEAFRVLVRKVSTVGTRRTLYGGAPLAPSDSVLSVPYAANDFRVEVAAPFYGATGEREYQFRLAGRDAEWSEWRDAPRMTYTNVWEGNYRVKVRARTETGRVSRAASFSLHVYPPWYRTVWAYLVYAGLVGLVAFSGYRLYRLRQIRQEARERAEKLRREREANQRLEEANERLREANRLKEEFLANMSHELRTPLTNILGFTDVLREAATDEQKRHLDLVERNGRRLLDTFNALLDLANLRSGGADPELRPVNVAEEAQAAVEDVRPSAAQKDLDVYATVPDEPAYAKADERYLNQILSNLLENAVKFTEEGHVAVTVERDDEQVALAVSDTGIGIGESFQSEMFEDFKQESRGMAREYEGNGLGLAITQRLVNLMDGDISVDSTKGEGTTFTVRFARSSEAPPEEAREKASSPA